MELHENLKALGDSAGNRPHYEQSAPNKALLEAFPNPFVVDNPSGATGIVHITAPEFTSLCPKTGQPDFAVIEIRYHPNQLCVESKALKLYLGSFRNHGEFHEACVNRICNDLVELLAPAYLCVIGKFTPRGGIAFHPTATYFSPDKVV